MHRFLGLCLVVVSLLSGCAGNDGAAGAPGTSGPSGPSGPAGAPCSVADNGDGTRTISCPGSAPVTVADGAPGTSCTVTGGGTPVKTITCEDGTSATVSDGAPCSATDNGDGTKTLACPGSAPVVVRDGTRCSVVDNQDGTAILSCSDGTRTVLAAPLDTALDAWQDLPGAVVAVAAVGGASNADGTFAPGDRVSVTFTVRTAAGRLIPLRDVDAVGAWLAGPTSGYQHVLPADSIATMYEGVKAAARLNDDGSSTFTFPDAIPATFGAPLNDTAKFTEGEATGPLTAGTYTVALAAWKAYTVAGRPFSDAGSDARDVRLGHAPALEPRGVVSDAACAACHGGLRVHGGAFRSVALCVTCHTAGAEDAGSTDAGDATPVTIELSVLLHKLHDGTHLPSVNGVTTDATGKRVYGAGTPYLVGTTDFSGVRFPRFPNFSVYLPKDAGFSALSGTDKVKDMLMRSGVTDCAACHANTAAALAAPSRRACGSCHDDLDYALPYTSNGQTMPANMSETACATCHPAAALATAHRHPLQDPAVAPPLHVAITSLQGGSGPAGEFVLGDPLSVTLTLKDDAGADVPSTAFDSFSVALTGPTSNRQVVVPGLLTATPFDTSGRLAAASTTNKGSMSKVQPGGALVSETLTVDFVSATSFTLSGTVSGALGSGTLPGSPGTQPSGSSISNVVLTPAAVAQQLTVAFTGPTTYTVTGSVSGNMGGGTLPVSTSTVQRFTSTDGTVAFNLTAGTTAPAAGNNAYLVVVKGGAANPVLFAVVAGRTAFAAGDRFYYDLVAPAPSYTLALPMDLQFEYLGDADGTAGQVLTAANLPVRYGRQTLLERTGLAGSPVALTAAAPAMARYLYVTAIDWGLASGDYLVLEDGTANEEYVRVAAIDSTNRRLQVTTPLRFAHGAAATVQEATMVYRQEGPANTYVLSAATGQVTLNAAANFGNAFVLSYRTDAHFGWKRRFGDTFQSAYYAPLSEALGLDETQGDWRGKPLVAGTYTVAAWGFRSVEYPSGGTAVEWQTYRNTARAASVDLRFGAGTTLVPYARIDDADARCNACHGDLTFHGGGRRGGSTCLLCHATPGPAVGYRTLLHQAHTVGFPAMPRGAAGCAAACAACHGTADPTVPASRNHPTAQARPALDWRLACGGCHASAPAAAHFETTTGATSGGEACAVCHGPDREQPVGAVHRAR